MTQGKEAPCADNATPCKEAPCADSAMPCKDALPADNAALCAETSNICAAYALCCLDVTASELDQLFTYAVPSEMRTHLTVGMRVCVPFGVRDKPHFAYVMGFTDEPDYAPEKIKSIITISEDFRLFSDELLALAYWMRDKYYTSLIFCLKCLQPPGLSDRKKVQAAQAAQAVQSVQAAQVVQAVQSVQTAQAAQAVQSVQTAQSTQSTQSAQTVQRTSPAHRKNHTEGDNPSKSMQRVKAVSPNELTSEQHTVVETILARVQEGDWRPVLLHGVTGSGKTEVYLRIIDAVLQAGRQAIVLVPEIALTPQTVKLFTDRFGDAVAVTHSRLTPKERLRLWKLAANGAVSVMIGPRSAVFTPFVRLGVIIVDEEHEHTYRSEFSPKYDARAVAQRRCELAADGALLLMGSATPSMESYYRAQPPVSEYVLLRLTERVNKMFPTVRMLDMRQELQAGNTSLFGRAFIDAMMETLNEDRQVMLFLNRRGHSTFVSCRLCGHVMQCDNCNVNYTWHADGKRLLCHYCARTIPSPDKCPSCGSRFIRFFGVGTQKVEEEVTRLFPRTAVLRMDLDTVRRKNSHASILDAFRRGEAQVLVGTQMIAKGLDFPRVTLVGVVSADMSLFTGDFRAGEYTFQILTQVAGRAGRAEHPGQVFLQTYNPEHYALTLAQNGDYEQFYRQEITVRQAMGYPPFSHVFMVLFAGPDEKRVIQTLHKLLAVMRYCNKKGRFVMLGPAPAFISKIKKQYRWKLLIKCVEEEPLKQFVIYCMKKLRDNDPMTGITPHLTLDPAMIE